MSDPNQPTTPPGWYPDGQGGQRWWDGTQWTEHTQPPAGAPAAPQTPQTPQTPPADQPTMFAPNRAADFGQQPGQQPGQQNYGQQPGQQNYGQQNWGPPTGQQGYGAGGTQQFGAPGYGAPSGGGGNNKKLGLIIGGAVAALLALVVLAVVLVTVLGGSGPEGVAKDYVAATFDRDYEEQCDLLSEARQKETLETAEADDCADFADKREEAEDESGANEQFEQAYGESSEDIQDDVEYDFEVTDVKEDGDEATVTIDATYTYTGDNDKFIEDSLDGKTEDSTEGDILLVKEDGDWKVDDEKNAAEGSEDGAGSEGGE